MFLFLFLLINHRNLGHHQPWRLAEFPHEINEDFLLHFNSQHDQWFGWWLLVFGVSKKPLFWCQRPELDGNLFLGGWENQAIGAPILGSQSCSDFQSGMDHSLGLVPITCENILDPTFRNAYAIPGSARHAPGRKFKEFMVSGKEVTWNDMKCMTWMNWGEWTDMKELKRNNWNQGNEMNKMKWLNWKEGMDMKGIGMNKLTWISWNEWIEINQLTWINWKEGIDMNELKRMNWNE